MSLKNHFFPESVSEALRILGNSSHQARLISGGTDLVVSLREGKAEFDSLVDTGRISGLDIIGMQDGIIRLGARVTMTQAEENQIIRQYAAALREGCGWVGGPQIRNRATIVGNIISAQPAADTAVPLFCFNAKLEVTQPSGTRIVPIEEAYISVGKSSIDPAREMVTAVTFQAQGRNTATAYKRLMKRKALTLPVLSAAVWVTVEEDRFKDVRIALGPVAAVPLRAEEAEEYLRGETLTVRKITEAAELARGASTPRTSPFRGSSAYRKEMVRVLVRDALLEALDRLGKEAAAS